MLFIEVEELDLLGPDAGSLPPSSSIESEPLGEGRFEFSGVSGDREVAAKPGEGEPDASDSWHEGRSIRRDERVDRVRGARLLAMSPAAINITLMTSKKFNRMITPHLRNSVVSGLRDAVKQHVCVDDERKVTAQPRRYVRQSSWIPD